MSNQEERFTDTSMAKPGDIWIAKFVYMNPDNKGRTYANRPVYIYSKMNNMFRVIEITIQNKKKKQELKGKDKKYFEYMYDLTEKEVEALKLKDKDSCIRCADVCDISKNSLKFRVCEYDEKSLIHKSVRRNIRTLYIAAIKNGALQHAVGEITEIYDDESDMIYRNMIRNIKLV